MLDANGSPAAVGTQDQFGICAARLRTTLGIICFDGSIQFSDEFSTRIDACENSSLN